MSNEQSIDLDDLLGTILRHKAIIAISILLMALLGASYAKTSDKIYYAHATILLEDKNKNLEIEALNDALKIDSLYILSEIQVLQSRELMEEVLNRMGVFDEPKLLLGNIKSDKQILKNTLINYALKNLTVSQSPKSRAIKIGYKSNNKEFSAWLVNTLVDLYIKKEVSLGSAELSSTNKWLRDRVQQISNSVKQIDNEIAEYRKSTNLIDNNGQNILENKIGQLSEKLIDAQVKLSAAQVKWQEISNSKSLKTAPEIIKSTLIQRLIEREALVKDEVSKLSEEYGESHPEMVSVNNRLKSIKNQIDYEVNKITSSLEREYILAKANVNEIKMRINDLKIEHDKMSRYDITLSSLERESEARKKLLDKLDARWKEIQIQEDVQVQVANASIISKASSPAKPQGLSLKIILLMSIIGGAAIGLGIAIILDYMQSTIYNGNQLQKLTSLPNIALIPKLSGSIKMEIQNSVRKLYKDPLSDYSESLRSLTAHLKRSIKDNPKNKIFNFTSVARGDGKSALVAAAACQMSLEGLKTIIIDCDLRNPTLGEAFKLHGKKGLGDLLNGDSKLSDVIYKDKDSSVDLIGIGALHDINIIKKSAKTWEQILARLSQDYDIILLDGPPVSNISDMSILAQDSQNILCIRWKKTKMNQITYAQNLLQSLNFSLLGTVITLVSPKKIKQLNKV